MFTLIKFNCNLIYTLFFIFIPYLKLAAVLYNPLIKPQVVILSLQLRIKQYN